MIEDYDHRRGGEERRDWLNVDGGYCVSCERESTRGMADDAANKPPNAGIICSHQVQDMIMPQNWYIPMFGVDDPSPERAQRQPTCRR